MTNKIGEIIREEDYSVFKELKGNRKDAENRSGKIIASIKENGYVLSPIAVNEFMEVIDGQARLIALKKLGMPVDYYIAPGASIKDCIAMNIYGTKWTLNDYIDSYADLGTEDYVILRNAIQKWKKEFHLTVIISIMTGKYSNSQIPAIRYGRFKLENRNLEMLDDVFTSLLKVKESLRWMKGNIDKYLLGYQFVAENVKNVDISRLINRIDLMAGQLRPAVDIPSALQSLSGIYNWKLQPENRLYFDKEYDQFQCITSAGYKKRWSEKKRAEGSK